jgi:hypothetical protein
MQSAVAYFVVSLREERGFEVSVSFITTWAEVWSVVAESSFDGSGFQSVRSTDKGGIDVENVTVV